MRRSQFPFILSFAAVFALIVPAVIRAGDGQTSGDTPKGEVKKYSFDHSKIFPGTVRDYWIYVPKQYDPEKPACLYVNQDGIQYKRPRFLTT